MTCHVPLPDNGQLIMDNWEMPTNRFLPALAPLL
jgi:hypothetical protein